jgi:hypothetical protein
MVDALLEDVWPAAERVLSQLVIPEVDAELTEEALARIEVSRAAAGRGEFVSHDEAICSFSDDQCVTF